VVYDLVRELAKKQDLQVILFGFQKQELIPNHRLEMPANVEIFDAREKEEPTAQGFGFTCVRGFMKEYTPDVCMVYNDMMILNGIISQLQLSKSEDQMDFKIIAYIDQIYTHQKREFIEFINSTADFALMFTKYWQDIIVEQGITLPSDFLQHGFNKETNYPVPKKLARLFYGIPENDFVILNLNRNQPRKRWDTCLQAFAEIVSRYPNEPIKLYVGTAVHGGWNLLEIFERELKKRKCDVGIGMQHLIIGNNPQQMSDEDINILYNIADIGINTCDGEGFGLCNFEQAAVGIPQVVPKLGGFLDFFTDDNALMIKPKVSYYVDNSRDMVCGEAQISDYADFVEAIEKYYFNKELRADHGTKCREHILAEYKWSDIASKLHGIIMNVVGKEDANQDLLAEVEKIDTSVFTLLESKKVIKICSLCSQEIPTL
jgi:glycosyltransferase involved in cell wall biosynthesis